jgi:hypothetical protein
MPTCSTNTSCQSSSRISSPRSAAQKQLKEGIVSILRTLKTRASAVCDQAGLKITRIGLMIPARWILDFENLHRGLVKLVFPHVPSDDITFLVEPEAVGRHLLRERMERADAKGKDRLFIISDHGGHCQVSTSPLYLSTPACCPVLLPDLVLD